MRTTGIICARSTRRVSVDLSPDVACVATCTAIVDNPPGPLDAFVLNPVEIAAGIGQVELSLPSGALVWIVRRMVSSDAAVESGESVRVYVVGVGGALDLLREAESVDIATFVESMSADRFKIQCAALPEQQSVREAVLAELVTGGAEVFGSVAISWPVWAKWDPGVARNRMHTEVDCTVVDPGGGYIWVFADRIIRKTRANVIGELSRLQAEAAAARRAPAIRRIGVNIRAALDALKLPDLIPLARLTARERRQALDGLAEMSVPAQRLLAEAVAGLGESLDRRRLSGDFLRACTDPDARAAMEDLYVGNKQG